MICAILTLAMRIEFEEADKREADAQLIMHWRNDPAVLAVSYHSEPKQWPAFWAEYLADYFLEPDLPSLFAVYAGRRVGVVRFQSYTSSPFTARTVSIGINLDPALRGKGLGPHVIEQSTDIVLARGIGHVIAEIKRHNLRSIRAFEKSGYEHYDAMDKRLPDLPTPVPILRMVKSAGDRSAP